jgi:hypothetical protein
MGWGGDSEFRSPMAIAVIGGLVTSTLLTLIIVPAIFTVFDDVERWIGPRAGKLLAEPVGTISGQLPGPALALGPRPSGILPDKPLAAGDGSTDGV